MEPKSKESKPMLMEFTKEITTKRNEKEMENSNGSTDSTIWESGRKAKDMETVFGLIELGTVIMEIGSMEKGKVMESTL